jgi:type 1 glutamine amidotransferase
VKRAVALLPLALALGLVAPDGVSAPSATPRLLVFTKTAGFRHDSIPVAIQAVQKLGAQNGFSVDATEDAGMFTDAGLAPYAAVVFLMTTGDVLDDGQQAAFERYIRAGRGWVGVHSAADTEYDWSWYGGLVGAYFRSHPAIQPATIDVADPRTISTTTLPARWMRTDEWYNFQVDPRPSVHVLATLEESSYDGGDMGADHPIAWWHDYDGGRAWYTAGGHTNESWSEPLFLAHVLGGIEYAIGAQLAPAAQPKIISLAATVHARRVRVTVRYTGCDGCTGTLRVGTAHAALSLDDGTGRGTSPRLPRGHARVIVVLSRKRVRLTASRPVLVR